MKVEEEEEEELISGLPADVARECLTRVPYTLFPTLHLVSRHFKHELLSDSFHSLRRSNGSVRHVIAFLHSSDPKTPGRNYNLSLLDPAAATFLPLPSIPGGLPFPLFPRLVPVHRGLAVIGGWDPLTWRATDEVHLFDSILATWRNGARMPGPRRSFFGCGASDSGRAVVVAGGHDERKDAMRSAMRYDLERDEWAPLPDMECERDECSVVCLRGRFWAVGGYRTERQGRFKGSAEVLRDDSGEIRWGPVEEGFLGSATCPSTCAGDGKRLYVCKDGHVAVREEEKGWRKVVELPEDVRAALQVVAWDGRLVVLGSGRKCGAPLCYLLGEDWMTWRKVELPEEYSGHVHAACCLEI